MRCKLAPLFAGVLAALALSPAQADLAAGVVEGFSNPESVLIDGPRRYVSNLGAKLDPTGHDGDGFISELDAAGRIVALRAFPAEGETLDAPKGMALANGRLYVADIDRIVGFDVASRRKVFEARVPAGEPGLLNDIAVVPHGLAVSDTLRGTVYRVDLGTGAFEAIASGIPGANGIAWDARGNRLLVAGLGARFEGGDLFEVTADGKVRKLGKGPHGILDGLALLPDERMLISDWRSFDPPSPGGISLHAGDGTELARLSLPREVHGPADFAVDAASGLIWVPVMRDGTVLVTPLVR
ncbi:SMP-30/gluconolactonase/LRE family protein [Stappia sp.]|uniref:SMP-30/gluconolactonase/LRE family protein n=1 Tax=Stappia sp. TaxID=1870903 RepID=UPI003A9A0C56